MKPEMQRFNLQITQKHKELLNKHNKEGQSISAFVRNILDDYFEKLKNEKGV